MIRTPPEPGSPYPLPPQPPRESILDALANMHARRCRWLLERVEIAAVRRKESR